MLRTFSTCLAGLGSSSACSARCSLLHRHHQIQPNSPAGVESASQSRCPTRRGVRLCVSIVPALAQPSPALRGAAPRAVTGCIETVPQSWLSRPLASASLGLERGARCGAQGMAMRGTPLPERLLSGADQVMRCSRQSPGNRAPNSSGRPRLQIAAQRVQRRGKRVSYRCLLWDTGVLRADGLGRWAPTGFSRTGLGRTIVACTRWCVIACAFSSLLETPSLLSVVTESWPIIDAAGITILAGALTRRTSLS